MRGLRRRVTGVARGRGPRVGPGLARRVARRHRRRLLAGVGGPCPADRPGAGKQVIQGAAGRGAEQDEDSPAHRGLGPDHPAGQRGDRPGLKADGRSTPPLHREPGLRTMGACPRDAPGWPSIANDRHQQYAANMELARALNLRATHENTLVMRSSLGGDEDQAAGPPTVMHDHRRRARVPGCAAAHVAGSATFRRWAYRRRWPGSQTGAFLSYGQHG